MAGRGTDRHFLSPQEFSRASGLSLATVYRYLRRGRLPYRQPGGPRGRLLIPTHALDLAPPTPPHDIPAPTPCAAAPPTATPAPAPPLPGPRPRWTTRTRRAPVP